MNLLLSSRLAVLLLFTTRVAHGRLRGDAVVSESRTDCVGKAAYLLPLDDRNQNTAAAEQGSSSRTSESTLTSSIIVFVRNRNAFCRV